jgi:hypoxanthine phosphoribosyltransferase
MLEAQLSNKSAGAKLKVLIREGQIQVRIREIARQIEADYPSGPLYMIGILKGACFFLSDLVREINRPVRIDFIGTSSYAQGTTSSGEVKLTKDLDVVIEGADVILVEDIVDTGITLSYLRKVLLQRKPRSLRIATLLDKPERRVRPIDVAYCGFTIPNQFVVGFGLDYAEDYRHLRDVCVIEEEPAVVSASGLA